MAFTSTPSLNDPQVLGDDTIYVIIQASSQRTGAMRCEVVLEVLHLTLPLLTKSTLYLLDSALLSVMRVKTLSNANSLYPTAT